jgi:hypothetical protein
MKPTVTNCFPCWTEDQRATPATWAHGDDFYCDLHLRSAGIDVGECETIEAWRAAHGQPVHTPEVEARREIHAAAGRKNGKALTDVCQCGKPARHRGRCRKFEGVSAKAPTPRANRGSTEPSHSGRATGPKFLPASQKASNRVQQVAGFDMTVLSLQEYRETMPARFQQDVLDPLVQHVKGMRPNTVVLLTPPKDQTLKHFRDRLQRALRQRNKVAVSIEERKNHGVVAVIRREEARA